MSMQDMNSDLCHFDRRKKSNNTLMTLNFDIGRFLAAFEMTTKVLEGAVTLRRVPSRLTSPRMRHAACGSDWLIAQLVTDVFDSVGQHVMNPVEAGAGIGL